MIERRQAITTIMKHVGVDDLLLTTTGMISREAFATQDRPGNFYMIGSMGLLSSFGLGLALIAPDRRIVVLEGDGSALMSLGTLPLIGSESPENLLHIILDNEAYESTGGQASISSKVDLSKIGSSCGYHQVMRVHDIEGLDSALVKSGKERGPFLIVVKAGLSQTQNIPRVSHPPTEIRNRFRRCLLNHS